MHVCNELKLAVERIVVSVHICLKIAGKHCVAKGEPASDRPGPIYILIIPLAWCC